MPSQGWVSIGSQQAVPRNSHSLLLAIKASYNKDVTISECDFVVLWREIDNLFPWWLFHWVITLYRKIALCLLSVYSVYETQSCLYAAVQSLNTHHYCLPSATSRDVYFQLFPLQYDRQENIYTWCCQAQAWITMVCIKEPWSKTLFLTMLGKVAPGMALSVCWSNSLVQTEISQQLFNGLLWKYKQTFHDPRGWI